MPRAYRKPVRREPSVPESPHRSIPWYVNIPFQDLNKLVNQLESLDELKQDNAQLRRELDGMRNMFSELQVAFGELRRELRGR